MTRLRDQDERLTVRAGTAKDAQARLLPISARPSAVVPMAKTDPAGRGSAADAVAFGELGERLGSIKTWAPTVLKARGINPAWVEGRCRPTAVHA